MAGAFEDLIVTIQDVLDQLKCLDISKSYGLDLTSSRYLKEDADILAVPLWKKL